MPDETAQALHRQTIGALLRNARIEAGQSRSDCAKMLGCSSKTIARFEEGQAEVTLTQLEVLAQYLGVPSTYFWREPAPSEGDSDSVYEPPALLQLGLELRQKLLGVQLRQARLAASKSQKECARLTGCSTNRYYEYETGKRDIPLKDLEVLASSLGVPIQAFLCDDEGRPYDYVMGIAEGLGSSQAPGSGTTPASISSLRELRHLSPEMRAFIAKPVNTLYLLLALKLSMLPVSSLRQIGESLLEITY